MAWGLSCFTSKGLRNHAHAYKAMVEENKQRRRVPDYRDRCGSFQLPDSDGCGYPVIWLTGCPGRAGSRQHVEKTRDMTMAANQEGYIHFLNPLSMKPLG